jgi:hypothetical protein
MGTERRKYILLIMFFIVLALSAFTIFQVSNQGISDIGVGGGGGGCVANGDEQRNGRNCCWNGGWREASDGTCDYKPDDPICPGKPGARTYNNLWDASSIGCNVSGSECPAPTVEGQTAMCWFGYARPEGRCIYVNVSQCVTFDGSSASCNCGCPTKEQYCAGQTTCANCNNPVFYQCDGTPPVVEPPVVNPPTGGGSCPASPDGGAPNSCYTGGSRFPCQNPEDWVAGYYDCNTTTPPPPPEEPEVPEEPTLAVCGAKCNTPADCADSTQNNVDVDCRDVNGTKRCVNTQCPNNTVYGTLCQCTTKVDICGAACGSVECKYPLRCTFRRANQCERDGVTTYCVPPGTAGYGRGDIPGSWYPNSDDEFSRRKCSNSNNNYLYHPSNPSRAWTQSEIEQYICSPREIPQVCGDGEVTGTEECDPNFANTCASGSTCVPAGQANQCTCEEDEIEPADLTCTDACDPNNDLCSGGTVCDPSVNRCTIPQCVGGGVNCAADRCSITAPNVCGASCNPSITPDQCASALGSSYSCDPDSNTCKLNSCVDNAACTDGGCTLPYCGDGVCQTGETCEIANPGSGTPIYGTCSTVNGVPGSPALSSCREVQTSYSAPDTDSCSYCGDGVVQSAYEQCDFNAPGATNCNTSCQTVTPVCLDLISADQDGIIGDDESVTFTFTYTNVNEGDPYPNIQLLVHDGDASTIGTVYGSDANATSNDFVTAYQAPSSSSTSNTKTYRFEWLAIDDDGVTSVPDGTYQVSVLLDSTDNPGSLVTSPTACTETIEVDTAEPAEAAFIVTKSASAVCQESGDAQVDYTITVTNAGEGTGTLSSIVDTIDTDVFNAGIAPFNISDSGSYAAGEITWDPAGIGEDSYTAGQSREYTFSITIPEDELPNYQFDGVDNAVTITDSNDDTATFETNTVMDCELPEVVSAVEIPATGIIDDEIRYILVGMLMILTGLIFLRYDIGRERVQIAIRKAYYSSPLSTYEDKVEYEREQNNKNRNRS